MMVSAWSLLASVLADEHATEEALEKLELAEGSAREVKDLHTLAALAHNGAFVLSRAGRIDDAIASFERAVDLNTQVYGPQHREVAASRASLGMELLGAGRTDEARTQLQTALVIVQETGGDRHHSIAAVLQSLGQLCLTEGDLDCAERNFEHARLVYEYAYGTDGNPTLHVLSDLASLRRQQGRIDEALQITQLVYDRGKAEGHAPSAAFARAAGNLAVMRASTGDWAGALELAKASRATFVAAVGDRDPHLVHADTMLGTILRELGRLEDSRTALLAAYELAPKVLLVRDRERINASVELGHTYLALGEHDAAATVAEEALAALTDPPGPPPVVAEAEFLLARALGPSSSQARDRARRALAIVDELGDATTAAKIRAWIDDAE
jgi:tetratricopeptide (TPR) repeat protein